MLLIWKLLFCQTLNRHAPMHAYIHTHMRTFRGTIGESRLDSLQLLLETDDLIHSFSGMGESIQNKYIVCCSIPGAYHRLILDKVKDMFQSSDGRFGSYLLCKLTVVCVVWFSFIWNIQVCLVPFCRAALPQDTLIWETMAVRVNSKRDYSSRDIGHKNIDTPLTLFHHAAFREAWWLTPHTHVTISNKELWTLDYNSERKPVCFVLHIWSWWRYTMGVIYNDKNNLYSFFFLIVLPYSLMISWISLCRLLSSP